MTLIRKKTVRSLVLWLVVLAIVLVSATVYIDKKYFFDPLTFRNNNVLYLPWSWYKKPLNIQIATGTGAPSKVVKIDNQGEIRLVISELEQGNRQKVIPLDQMNLPSTDQTYNMLIRTQGSLVLQMVYMYPKEHLAKIYTQHGSVGESEFIELTPSLLEYVANQFKM